MSGFLGYCVAILVSLALHLGLIAVLFVGWQPEATKVMIQPQYIEATLVELAPKKKAVPKSKPQQPKVDKAKQQRGQAAPREKASAEAGS